MELQQAINIFQEHGIAASIHNDSILISHYKQPEGTTFFELGINEDELIENVIGCAGVFDALKSKLTTFPLVVSQEIRLYEDTQIKEMPNLKAVAVFIPNKNIKKLPKVKYIGSVSFEESPIKTLPKLEEAGIFIAQNSQLKDLSALEKAEKLCIIDCPLEDLKNLETVGDLFICSSDENNKTNIKSLNSLEEADKIFIANTNLKSLSHLKKANKIALYNNEIKSIKQSISKDVEIENKITDEQLSDKFDTFTDWYNSDILQKSMDIIGDIVNQIQR